VQDFEEFCEKSCTLQISIFQGVVWIPASAGMTSESKGMTVGMRTSPVVIASAASARRL